MTRTVPLALLALALGCGGRSASQAEAPSDAEASPEAPAPAEPAHPAVTPNTPFDDQDLAALAERWQGAWVVPGAQADAAWHVEGDQLTVFDGEREVERRIEIVAPCHLIVHGGDEQGRWHTWRVFAFGDDKVYAERLAKAGERAVGTGETGVLTDDGAIVCLNGKLLEIEGDTCREWDESLGEWYSEEAECSLDDDGFRSPYGQLDLVDGVLLGGTEDRVARRYDSFEDARAALAP